ncbi:hypothetical protein OKW96_04210 [Sphingobacterium sp. KU25419]|nr:hypothetical protein OKW96_04210 [Sphingobacterium sp. KU25419]
MESCILIHFDYIHILDDLLSIGDYKSHVYLCQLDHHSKKYWYPYCFISAAGFSKSGQSPQVAVIFGLWGTLIILGSLKAIGQKYIGFDHFESAWLYTFGAHTHVIYSGIRYFSFFTDAANFGCHMGLGIVVFTILSFYEKSP